MFDYATLQKAYDKRQAYFKSAKIDYNTKIIVSKFPYTKYEIKVVNNSNYVKYCWRGLSPFDCMNLIEEVIASVKSVK
ncbi:MAG: hypothetical protein II630_09535 [Bacteroidales bacterium]|nr:hypothetical protein [Bacteroidales bacterium]